MSEERLQKVLASAGVDSRRKCEELILSGAVRINGRVVDKLPAFVDPERDNITVDGVKVRAAPKVYFVLNKPKGVICTNFDPAPILKIGRRITSKMPPVSRHATTKRPSTFQIGAGRKKAIDIVKSRERIFCVGRLDADSTGMIILTNDNELANKLTHPRYGLVKTYIVKVRGEASGERLEKLKRGIWLSEGKTNRASVKILKRSYKESLVEIAIREGLNRQIWRMFAKVGYKVVSLKGTHIGRLDFRGLGVGKYRRLSGSETAYLKKVAAIQENPASKGLACE